MNRHDSPPERLTTGDELQTERLSSEQKEEIITMIKTEKDRIQRLRSVTILSYVAAGLSLILGGAAEAALPDSLAVPAAATIAMGLLTIAIVLTVSYFLRSRGLGLRLVETRLANIEAELARIAAGLPSLQDKRDEQSPRP